MKYFNVQTIENLYKSLKEHYQTLKISRKNSFVRYTHAAQRNMTNMREELVNYLIHEGLVIVHRSGRHLALEDVQVCNSAELVFRG